MNLLATFGRAILLLSTILLVVVLRFSQLGSVPPGIALDEANYGYDAYSIIHTGRDMWGQIGTSLKSLGEYKPIGLTATLLPIINYLGLSPTATRLPSAVLGLLTLVVTYFTLNLLLQKPWISLVGTIILALSPWHFGLSRQYYESVSGLFFITASIYYQLKYLRSPSTLKYLVIASVLAAFAGYYYQVLRHIGLGLIGLSVLLAHLPKAKKVLRYSVVALLCWGLAGAFYLPDMLSSRGLMRLTQENAMHENGDVLVVTEKRQMCYLSSDKNPWLSRICYAWWNKPGEKIINIGRTYIELFSPRYLFISNNQADTISESSGPYLEILAVFYLLGLYFLVRNSGKIEHRYLLLAYLFSAVPIAISFSLGVQRNVVGLYLALLISVYGIAYGWELWSQSSPRLLRSAGLFMLALVFTWFQSRYIANYFLVYTKLQPLVWHSDTPEVMEWLAQNRNGREIIFYDFSYGSLYYAFVNKFDPNQFQQKSLWSEPDAYGALNIVGITDLISSSSDPYQAICAHKDKSESAKLLVVTGSKPEWSQAVLKQTKSITGIHVLHEIYDSQSLYDRGLCNSI